MSLIPLRLKIRFVSDQISSPYELAPSEGFHSNRGVGEMSDEPWIGEISSGAGAGAGAADLPHLHEARVNKTANARNVPKK